MQDAGYRIQDAGCSVLATRHSLLGARRWMNKIVPDNWYKNALLLLIYLLQKPRRG